VLWRDVAKTPRKSKRYQELADEIRAEAAAYLAGVDAAIGTKGARKPTVDSLTRPKNASSGGNPPEDDDLTMPGCWTTLSRTNPENEWALSQLPKMMLALLSFRVRPKVGRVCVQLGRKSLKRASVKRRQGKRKLLGRSAQFLRAPQEPLMLFGDGFVAKHERNCIRRCAVSSQSAEALPNPPPVDECASCARTDDRCNTVSTDCRRPGKPRVSGTLDTRRGIAAGIQPLGQVINSDNSALS
jgi:hypothetical protein